MGPAIASSRLAGLIGFGIQGSLTPAMHEQEGAAQGMRYVYRKIDLQQLGLDVAGPARAADRGRAAWASTD